MRGVVGDVRYAYDCEFIEDGVTICLISIGIVAGDGREYYAVASDAPWGRIKRTPWLMRNAVPSLPGAGIQTPLNVPADKPEEAKPGQEWYWQLDLTDTRVKPEQVIANEVRVFLLAGDGKPQLWADCGAYDHVKLMQLWGDMSRKPAGLPYYTRDIQQEIDRLTPIIGPDEMKLPEQETGMHDALHDARHVYDVLIRLDELVAGGG